MQDEHVSSGIEAVVNSWWTKFIANDVRAHYYNRKTLQSLYSLAHGGTFSKFTSPFTYLAYGLENDFHLLRGRHFETRSVFREFPDP